MNRPTICLLLAVTLSTACRTKSEIVAPRPDARPTATISPQRLPADAPFPTGLEYPCDSQWLPEPRGVTRGLTGTLPTPGDDARSLLQLRPRVDGSAVRNAAAPLGKVSSGWKTTRDGDDVVMVLSALSPKIRDAALAVAEVSPGLATEVRFGVVSRAWLLPSDQKRVYFPTREIDGRSREVSFPFGPRTEDGLVAASTGPAAAQPDVHQLEINLSALLRQNWSKGRASDFPELGQIGELSIRFKNVGSSTPQIGGVSFFDEGRQFSGEAAGIATLEREGIIREGWFIRSGSTARYTIKVPEGPSELTGYALVTPGTRGVSLRIESNLSPQPLTVETATAWTPFAADLTAWAGQEVTLVVEVTGKRGLFFLGAPRIAKKEIDNAVPDVIVYLIDTMRADELGFWGYPREQTSPNLDALAQSGLTFGLALTPASWTKPATASLMTGLDPTIHQVGARSYGERLAPDVPLLQERFATAGWRTGSFIANPLAGPLSGLERGFQTGHLPSHWPSWGESADDIEHPTSDDLHAKFFEWAEQSPATPLFAYIHNVDVHSYSRPFFGGGHARLDDSYHRAVKYFDLRFGQFLQKLRATRTRDLVLVVTSDHGESFPNDHGVGGHGTSLYQAQLHIPLIFYVQSARTQGTINTPVSLLDVAPTLLDLFALPPLANPNGQTLMPYLRGQGPLAPRVLRSSLTYFTAPPIESFAMIDTGLRKAIWKGGAIEEYDLATSFCESASASTTGLAAEVKGWAETWRTQTQVGRARSTQQPGDLDALRALGYVH